MMRSSFSRTAIACVTMACVGLSLSGCKIRQGMWDQPKFEPMEKTDFFGDGLSARTPVEGTIPRGGLKEDTLLHTGMVDGAPSTEFPFEVTEKVLERGQTRYNIYCTPCHDRTGSGNGMVVQRGYKRPSSYHIDRLRDAEPGYFFQVMTEGFGVMPSYSYPLNAEDRWAVAAYIRVLQFSQHAPVASLPDDVRQQLEEGSQ